MKKLLSVVLAVVMVAAMFASLSTLSASAADLITDPNLASLIRSKLGLGAGDELNQEQLEKLVILDTGAMYLEDITTLEGLQYCTNLESLGLTYCLMSTFTDLTPLSNLEKLHTLVIDGSQVSDLSPLANVTTLKRLSFSDTKD